MRVKFDRVLRIIREMDESPFTGTAADIPSSATGDVAATNVQAAIAELASEKQAISAKDQISGYAGLDGSGKINPNQLPALAISEFLGNFADTTAALADAGVLASQKGDWFTVDTSGGLSYIVITDSPTVVGDIKLIKTPTDAVASIFGRTGVVTAQNGDYTASQVTFVAAGGIAAVTVQAAIEELDSEKLTASATNGVTNAMLAQVATATFKGRTTAGTGNVEDLTATQATAMLNVFGADLGAGGVKGLVPATVAGDATKFLRGDGTWAAAGVSWGTSIAGTTTGGLALTLSNTSNASAVAQSITIADTQSNALFGLTITTGASAQAHVALKISATTNTRQYGIISNFNETANVTGIPAKPISAVLGVVNSGVGLLVYNAFSAENNASIANRTNNNIVSVAPATGSASTTVGWGLMIATNNAGATANVPQGAEIDFSNRTSGTAGTLLQILTGTVADRAIQMTVPNSAAAQSTGWVNYTLGNTQTNAQVVQYIDTGSGAAGHTGLHVQMINASTSATGIKINRSTGGSGMSLYLTGGRNDGGYTVMQIDNGTNEIFKIAQNNSQNAANAWNWRIGGANGGNYTNNHQAFQIYNGDSSLSTTGTLTAKTANTFEFIDTRNMGNAATIVDDFATSYIKRQNRTNHASANLTASGSVQKLENVATQTLGTLADGTVVLSLIQDNDSTGGHILFNTYSGSPTVDGTFWFDGTNMKFRAGGATKTITAV